MNATFAVPVPLDQDLRRKANEQGLANLQIAMRDGRHELNTLRLRLALTYWIVVVLSVILFGFGVLLLSVPAALTVLGRTAELQAFIAAGFGLADLTALFLFRPLERIHRLMGDMSQISVALTSFQTQVELQLIQMDATSQTSIAQSAGAIAQIAPVTIKLIQDYFETPADAR